MSHHVVTVERQAASGEFLPRCSCGWVGPDVSRRIFAEAEGETHVIEIDRWLREARADERQKALGILMSCECPHEGPDAAPCQGLVDAATRIAASGAIDA